MGLTEDLRKKALEVGFVSVGITRPDMLLELPHGKVWNIYELRSPEELLPNVKSVILLGYYVWDRAFNIQVDSLARPSKDAGRPENYQLYYEVLKNKAWTIVDYLNKKGFESKWSLSIPLKTSAVKCGLGCQGKNTLLITPKYGSRVRLIAVLTTAELEVDEPFKEDYCRNCQKCVDACPTKALKPYNIVINRCMTYSAENATAKDVSEDVKALERKLVPRPTSKSYIECTICMDACPIGRTKKKDL
jgi:epoxyqueuosine reductase